MKKKYQAPQSEIISMTLSHNILDQSQGEGGVLGNENKTFEESDVVTDDDMKTSSSLWDN